MEYKRVLIKCLHLEHEPEVHNANQWGEKTATPTNEVYTMYTCTEFREQ